MRIVDEMEGDVDIRRGRRRRESARTNTTRSEGKVTRRRSRGYDDAPNTFRLQLGTSVTSEI